MAFEEEFGSKFQIVKLKTRLLMFIMQLRSIDDSRRKVHFNDRSLMLYCHHPSGAGLTKS